MSTAGAGYRLICVTEESAEIFDDLYLGLRAGGAIRKQRRGQPLTQEERDLRIHTFVWRDTDWGLTAERVFPRGREPLESEPV